MKKKNLYENFYIEVKKISEDNNLSQTAIVRLWRELKKIVEKQLDKKEQQWSSKITTQMNGAYRTYVKSSYSKSNEAIKGWRLNQLKKEFRRELQKRIKLAAELIKDDRDNIQKKIKSRFFGICSGAAVSPSKMKKELGVTAALNSKDKKVKQVIVDQTRKMLGSFDGIVAHRFQAVALIWRTQEDSYVVGKPGGAYPEGNPLHQNHYKRNGQIYFYPNSWALQNKLINTKHEKFKTAEFDDGLPGEPINCRCWRNNLFTLKELVEELGKDILTAKGQIIYEKSGSNALI